MENTDTFNSKSVKGFIKGSLVLIGLFAVLYCSVAVLLLLFGNNFGKKECLLIIVLVVPIIVFILVFFRFSYLVKSYYENIFRSSRNKTEENILKEYKIKVMSQVCHLLAKVIKPDSEKNVEALKELIKEIP